MSLGNITSESQAEKLVSPTLLVDSQNRVNSVAASAIAILENDPKGQEAIKSLFESMLTNKLSSPEKIGLIQDGLYTARDARLKDASPTERLSILEGFSKFITQFTDGIAKINNDVQLTNEAHSLTNASDTQIAQVQENYARILSNNHPTQSA